MLKRYKIIIKTQRTMQLIKFSMLLISFIILNSSYLIAQDLKPDEATTGHLKKFRADYIKSFVEKTPDLIQGYYVENIRLMPEFQKTIMGKPNALTYHKAFLARFDVKEYTRNELEILDMGSRVVEFGFFTMKITQKTIGEMQDIQGKYFTIWEKPENGKLQLITEGWNYNHPVKASEIFIFEEVPVVDIALQAHVPVNSNISFELMALNRLQEEAITFHEDNIWKQYYTDDIKCFYSNNPLYTGRKEVDEFLKHHVLGLPIFEKLDIRSDRIDELGIYVIEYASHIAIIRDGDYSGVHTGKDIRIWRREKNGSLKIFRGFSMYD